VVKPRMKDEAKPLLLAESMPTATICGLDRTVSLASVIVELVNSAECCHVLLRVGAFSECFRDSDVSRVTFVLRLPSH